MEDNAFILGGTTVTTGTKTNDGTYSCSTEQYDALPEGFSYMGETNIDSQGSTIYDYNNTNAYI